MTLSTFTSFGTTAVTPPLAPPADTASHNLLTVHGNLNEWALRQKAVKKWVYMKAVQGRVLRAADALHAITRVEADRIAELGFQPPVFVAPNGIAPELLNAFDGADSSGLSARYPELSGKRVIMFLGRLRAIKGLDVLARSFAALAQDIEEAVLLVAGPRPRRLSGSNGSRTTSGRVSWKG